ncbi:CinA family protein [Teichococcus aestuarii]|uniref:CinA family protein n=1 Tax=Teichococcus aestuarii TaxID=568898 RepID=UPI003619776B
MLDATTRAAAAALLAELQALGLTLATAESCTGGLVSAVLTAVPGSSATLLAGYVTYSNAAKARMLGVPEPMLATHGAVSEPVARAMAEGALRDSGADLAVSLTGIAGPGGATPGKPVGLVHIAASRRGGDPAPALRLPRRPGCGAGGERRHRPRPGGRAGPGERRPRGRAGLGTAAPPVPLAVKGFHRAALRPYDTAAEAERHPGTPPPPRIPQSGRVTS